MTMLSIGGELIYEGDKLIYTAEDFDGKTELVGVVTKCGLDANTYGYYYIITTQDGINLWLDESNIENFKRT